MRIAIYGGSFNPPHLGHQLACTVLLAGDVDEVWLVPTFQHAFDKPLAAFEQRFAMCELAMRVFGGRVRISRIEEELGGASYTLRTLRALMERHPEHAFSWVIGGDLLTERHRWHRWDELSAIARFIVIGRAGTSGAIEANDTRVPIELPDISSTDVRRRVATSASTVGVLDEAVRVYVDRERLYR